MLVDRYDLPASTNSAAARDAYVAGADLVLAAVPGAGGQLEQAIGADRQFALAHIALARLRFLEADVRAARDGAARAREWARSATARERSHVEAIALAIEGRPVDALAATRSHLVQFPQDAMVLAPATGVFGLVGFSGRQDREAELYDLLRNLAAHYGDDWWFNSAFAFAACECGHLDEAWTLIERSMAANPRNAHGAHIRVHVLYEMGEMAQALQFLDDWMPTYDRRGLMHCHLSWHVALCALALGRLERAWSIFRAGVRPGGAWGPPINVATDAPSFLWRYELAGQARPTDAWREVREYTQRCFPKAGLAFIDVHAALACIACGDADALDRLLGEIHERLGAAKYPAGGVVVLIAQGLAAYAKSDWNAAIALLEQALPETVRIGGSRAQRDLVENTLLAAYLRADRPADAKALVGRRIARRPEVCVAGFVPA